MEEGPRIYQETSRSVGSHRAWPVALRRQPAYSSRCRSASSRPCMNPSLRACSSRASVTCSDSRSMASCDCSERPMSRSSSASIFSTRSLSSALNRTYTVASRRSRRKRPTRKADIPAATAAPNAAAAGIKSSTTNDSFLYSRRRAGFALPGLATDRHARVTSPGVMSGGRKLYSPHCEKLITFIGLAPECQAYS